MSKGNMKNAWMDKQREQDRLNRIHVKKAPAAADTVKETTEEGQKAAGTEETKHEAK